jgi:hypothetical protein
VLALLLSASLLAAPCVPSVDVRSPGVPDEVAAAFAAEARTAAVEVRARLGSTACTPLTITLVPSMSDAAALDPPWHLPSWAAGAAEPRASRLVVGITAGGSRQDRRTTLTHELAHVVTAEVTGGRTLPRWLDEGIARVVAGEHGIEDLSLLAHARIADRFLPLAALERGFPPGAADAALAYAEAGRAVSLVTAGGASALPDLLAHLGTGAPLDDALVAVGGRAIWQLDQDLRRSLSGWAALAVVGVETDLAMAACAVVAAVVGVRARHRLRRRIAAMPETVDDLRANVVGAVRFRHGPKESPARARTMAVPSTPPATLAPSTTAC